MALYLGLDIGRTAIKCVALRTSYRKIRLESMALVELSEFAGDVTLAVQTAFARLFAGRTPHHDGIAIAIAGDNVSQKTIHLPKAAQKQVAEVLPLQLADEIPFEIEDAVFDFRLALPRTGSTASGIEVHAVVARVEDVRARIDFVKQAIAHEPERVGVGAFPLGNLVPNCPALLGAGPEEVVALLDLGMKQSDLLLLRAGEIVFSRTLSLGTEGLPGTAAKLARELRTSFLAHKAQGGDEPARLVLAGGGAFVSGAEVFLASQLGLATSVLGPPDLEIDTITRGASAKDAGPDPRVAMVQAELGRFARYAKALGLALGHTARAVDYDLRRGPLAFERGFGWIQSRVPQLVAFGVVLGIAVFVSATIRLVALSRERGVLEEALGTVTEEVLGESTTEADRVDELLAGQAEAADPDPLPHADSFDVLVALSKNIPESVVHDLEEVDIQKGKVLVHGIVGSVSEAQDILANMKTERCVFDPKITRTSQMVGNTRQKYLLEFEMRCPEDVKKDPKKKAAAPAASASGGE